MPRAKFKEINRKEHIGYAWLSFEEAMEKLERFKSLQSVLKKADKVLI